MYYLAALSALDFLLALYYFIREFPTESENQVFFFAFVQDLHR